MLPNTLPIVINKILLVSIPIFLISKYQIGLQDDLTTIDEPLLVFMQFLAYSKPRKNIQRYHYCIYKTSFKWFATCFITKS